MNTMQIAVYPRTEATREALCRIAKRYEDEYASALSDVPKDANLQKKALNMQKHMAGHAWSFPAMDYAQSTWEGRLQKREAILSRAGIVEDQHAALQELDADARGAFLLYVHAQYMLHTAILDPHLTALQTKGSPEQRWNDRIIVGTLYAILRDWYIWWQENGTLPFEKWTYEDTPWEVDV